MRIASAESNINSSPAYQYAVNIHNSITQTLSGASYSYNSNNAIPVRSGFPFIGTTNLTAIGKRIKDYDGNWNFLALRLISCTAKYPFDGFQIERDNDNRGTLPVLPRQGHQVAFANVRKPPKTQSPTVIYESDANYYLKDINLEQLNKNPRFTDLIEKKRARKRKIEAVAKFPTPMVQEETAISASAGEKIERNTRTRSINLAVKQWANENLPLHILNLQKALSILSDEHKILHRYSRIGNWESIGDCSYFPIEYNGKEIPWSLIQEYQRRVLLAEMTNGKEYFYTMEIERKRHEKYCLIIFHNAEREEISEDQIEILLTLLALYKMKKYPIIFETIGFQHRSFKHSYAQKYETDKPQAIVEKILGYISHASQQ